MTNKDIDIKLISQFKEKLGINNTQAGAMLGLTRQAIWQYSNGTYKLPKIVKILMLRILQNGS
ncbi:hypothetical protein OAF54_03225 [bacterium]|nr:hypothetical protein [bacterium]